MAILEATMREVRKRPFTFFSVQIQAKVTTSLKKGTDKVLQVDRKRYRKCGDDILVINQFGVIY